MLCILPSFLGGGQGYFPPFQDSKGLLIVLNAAATVVLPSFERGASPLSGFEPPLELCSPFWGPNYPGIECQKCSTGKRKGYASWWPMLSVS